MYSSVHLECRLNYHAHDHKLCRLLEAPTMKTKDRIKIYVPPSSPSGIILLVPYPIRKVFPFRLSESEDISP